MPEPWEEICEEDVVLPPLVVEPSVAVNATTILIADSFIGKIINENGVVHCKASISSTPCKEDIQEDFHALYFAERVIEHLGSGFYFHAFFLLKDVKWWLSSIEQVCNNGFNVVLVPLPQVSKSSFKLSGVSPWLSNW